MVRDDHYQLPLWVGHSIDHISCAVTCSSKAHWHHPLCNESSPLPLPHSHVCCVLEHDVEEWFHSHTKTLWTALCATECVSQALSVSLWVSYYTLQTF